MEKQLIELLTSISKKLDILLNDKSSQDAEKARKLIIVRPEVFNPEHIDELQIQELEEELYDHIDIAEDMMRAMSINSLADMPKSDFRATMKRVRDIKNVLQTRRGK